MKNLVLIAVVAMGLFGTTSCTSQKNNMGKTEKNENQISVTGTVTGIENGKDGYMASLQTKEGQIYVATISIVNLGENRAQYKTHQVGDQITVKGTSWKDAEGKTYITVRELK